jgi:hypothetical protein
MVGLGGFKKKLDVDGSGGISLKELKRAFLRWGWAFLANDVLYLFELMDVDGNNLIDEQELTRFMEQLSGKTKKTRKGTSSKQKTMAAVGSLPAVRARTSQRRPAAVGSAKPRAHLPALYWKLASEEAQLTESLKSVRQQKRMMEDLPLYSQKITKSPDWLIPGFMGR